jgi:anti-anti-sigma factor
MEISFSRKQSRVPVTVMQVRGKVDAANHQRFLEEAREAIRGGARYLLVDLSACDYMSSAGLRALNDLLLLFRQSHPADETGTRSARIKLVNLSEKLAEIFSVAGMDAFFEIHTEFETAVASF